MAAISSTTEPDADLILHNNFTLSRDLWTWCTNRDVRLIYASSAATYGDGSAGFRDDDDLDSLTRLRPLNAYGWSKALFDLYARRDADRERSPPQWAGLKFSTSTGQRTAKGAMKSVARRLAAGQQREQVRRSSPPYRIRRRDRCATSSMCAMRSTVGGARHTTPRGIFNLGTGEGARVRRPALAVYDRPASRRRRVLSCGTIRARYQYVNQRTWAGARGGTRALHLLEEESPTRRPLHGCSQTYR